MVFMRKRHIRTVLLALLVVSMPLALLAQDRAQLPYSMVNSYQQMFKSLEHLDRIIPGMMIVSTNPTVPPQAIEFKVVAAGGWQSFSPDENGMITFPDQPDWADLILISNQPKGTLQLAVSWSARPLDSTSMPYQELMSLVPQFQQAMTALSEMQGQPPPTVTGLTIQLPENSGAAVNILSQKGRKSLKSYATGVVVIKYSEDLWQENPVVEFDQLPIGIVPHL